MGDAFRADFAVHRLEEKAYPTTVSGKGSAEIGSLASAAQPGVEHIRAKHPLSHGSRNLLDQGPMEHRPIKRLRFLIGQEAHAIEAGVT